MTKDKENLLLQEAEPEYCERLDKRSGMIEFTKEELNKIRGDLRNELECSFRGDHTSMDVELAGMEYFDLNHTEVRLIQGMLAKIRAELSMTN